MKVGRKAKTLEIGSKWGKWKVIKEIGIEKSKGSSLKYLCICECGFEKEVLAYKLRLRYTKQCLNCVNSVKPLEIGSKFGKWTVIKEAGLRKETINSKWGRYLYYFCICECGNQHEVRATALRTGKSLRCLRCSQKRHGFAGSPIHQRWVQIKNRCSNFKNPAYFNYGGRGIKVCDRWLNSFENFYNDMGDIPFKGAQIDRIDPDGNYEPSNCRWVTPKENSNNKRNSLKNRHKYLFIRKDEIHKLAMQLAIEMMNKKRESESPKNQLTLFN